MYLLTQAQEYSDNWNLYFIRFLFVLWFIIWPGAFTLSFIFLKEINESKKTDITFYKFLLIKKYNYVFHNFTMVSIFCAWILNGCFLIYTFCDTYIFSLNNMYSWIWHIPSSVEGQELPKKSTFFAILLFGFVLHLISGLLYIYFNLYCTRSYFGEKWRNWIRNNMKRNSKWIRWRKRHPKMYEWLYPWFFDVNYIDKNEASEVYAIYFD